TLPGSKNSVVNWLDLRDQNLPQAIRGAVGARAAKDLQKADMERAVSVRRALWLGGLCFILAIAILLFMFSTGTRFWSLTNRPLAPSSDPEIAKEPTLVVEEPKGGNALVPHGKAIRFIVRIDGKLPDENNPAEAPRLLYRPINDKNWITQPLRHD